MLKQSTKHSLDLYWRAFKRFFRASWISLLITAVFVLLLTQMDQGSIILIDLLESPFNTALFLLISHLLAFVISLYPVYLSKWREGKHGQSNTKWQMHDDYLNIGLGIVVYDDSESEPTDTYILESVYRKFLGVVFYLGLLYVVMFVGNQYFSFPRPIVFWLTAFLITLFYIWISGTKQYQLVRQIASVLLPVFILSVLLLIGTIICAATIQWHWLTLLLLFLQLLISTFHFILFRRYRTLLTRENGAVFPYTKFANSLNYLRITTFGGWLTLIIFILSQFFVHSFNAAVIILCLFYTLYGIIIVPIKHYFYYRRNPEAKQRNPVFYFAFIYILPVFWVALFVFSIVTSMIGNNLHELDPMVTQKEEINHQVFVQEIEEYFTEKDTVYFIASSGGGLRANTWTQLLLEQLAAMPANDSSTVFESTIALSGVSGGALGSAFYTALYHPESHSQITAEKRDSIINRVGRLNALSLDVAWTFGADFIRELIPGNVPPPDRAKQSMLEYEKIIAEDNLMSTTDFQSYWASVFRQRRKKNSFMPALILNSSSYNQKRGIAFSVRTDEQFDRYFPDAINILRLRNGKSLSYLHAISPSNRFPVFSPGADIPGKGIFLDGGYFENSGMMSIWDLYSRLNIELPDFFSQKTVVFLQINNGKTSYAEELISPFQDSITIEVKDMGELSSILQTVLSTTMVSEYFQERLTQNENIVYTSLYLPYMVSEKKVKKMFFTQELPVSVKQVINENNDYLASIFSQYNNREYAEPPLGRLLTDKAVDYMNIVLEEDERIFRQFNEWKAGEESRIIEKQ